MIHTITIQGSQSSQIHIGMGIADQLDLFLAEHQGRIALISDTTVAPLYAASLMAQLKQAKLFTIPVGEQHKTRETVHQLQDHILEWGFTRDDLIIALGGGVVTDVAGYVAATLLRGVSYFSLPTTLLAMVDASIGGKTGVNTFHGKNMIGAFWPARHVLIDPIFLQSLPDHNLQEGCVEMIKHGMIADADYLDELMEHAEAILNRNLEHLTDVITKSCQIKADIVSEDGRESSGKRRILNFGHTIGHAIETLSDYQYSHGQAVAIGMVMEAQLAQFPAIARLQRVLDSYHQIWQFPSDLSTKALWKAMINDKKSHQRIPRIVMLKEVGLCDSCDGAYCQIVDEYQLQM